MVILELHLQLELSEADVSRLVSDQPSHPVVSAPAPGKSERQSPLVLRSSRASRVETDSSRRKLRCDPRAAKGQALSFRAVMRADALVIVTPEYNHGYPGLLKHALDTNLKEYIHKAVGIVGLSAGPWGGTRAIENLLPVMRELGLVTIFWDVNFSSVRKAFDHATGALLENAYVRLLGILQELG